MEDIRKIFVYLKKNGYKVFGPKEQDGELHILELNAAPEEKLLQRIAGRPYKYFFTPTREILLNFKNKKISTPKIKNEKIALFGMGLFDCKALELYDKVFEYPHPSSPLKRGRKEEGDIYYQERRKNIFIIGYSPQPVKNYKTIFFEINLESAIFDIFIESSVSSRASAKRELRNLGFYAQNKKGGRVLKKCGLKYKPIKYEPNKEDKKALAIKKAVEASKDSKLWDELGEICLACGKCAIACPTCYCFDIESEIGPNCRTERCSGNCFYDDFTRIAGGHKFLNNPKEKIFFWYYHKFVRVPFGYGLPGCVDCGRCANVCPVGIDIEKNIKQLLKEDICRKKK